MNKLHQILRNRYSIGMVSWRGVEYHPALVDAATFEAVRRLLKRELRQCSRGR